MRHVTFATLLLSLVSFMLISCENKERKVETLMSEYFETNGISVKEYKVNKSTMSQAKHSADNDSALWSLVPQWMECIRLIDDTANQVNGDPSAKESLMQVGFIMANEYVDSINYRIKQIDQNMILGYEFIQDVTIKFDNNEEQNIKFKIITDSNVSKIHLLIPIDDESERIIKIIEEARSGKLTRLPVDPQTEMMYYLSTGKSKPSL